MSHLYLFIKLIISLLIPTSVYILKQRFRLALLAVIGFYGIILCFTLTREITSHTGFLMMNGGLLAFHIASLLHGWFYVENHEQGGLLHAVSVACCLIFLSLGMGLCHKNKKDLMGFELYHIPSRSMEPTLHIGDIVLVDTWATKSQLKTKTVVVFQQHEKGLTLIKRIVDVRKNSTGADEIFVQGDNSDLSLDSRRFGWVPKSKVIGIAKAKLFSVYGASYDLYQYPIAL